VVSSLSLSHSLPEREEKERKFYLLRPWISEDIFPGKGTLFVSQTLWLFLSD